MGKNKASQCSAVQPCDHQGAAVDLVSWSHLELSESSDLCSSHC